MHTVYPTHPAKDFNDWMCHIQKQLQVHRFIDRINSGVIQYPQWHAEFISEIQKYYYLQKKV